jgi:trigger factor
MKIEKKDLEKSQLEINVIVEAKELDAYAKKAAEKIAAEIKIEGFRPGKAPYEMVKQKVGEMAIMEEASRLAVNKTIDAAIREAAGEKIPLGRPDVTVVKLAPGNDLEYKIVVAVLPETTLGDYKAAKVKMGTAEVKDEEVDKLLNDLREMRATEKITEEVAKDGDKVLVDINMYLDKIPVEGGQGKGATIIIGKDYIVPGFDKHLLGAKKGEKKEFSLPYPEDHHMKNLAGKMVEFVVDIKEVYERNLPELSDDMAAAFGAKKIEELKTNIRQSIESERKEQVKQKAEIEMMDKIIDSSTFGELPTTLIDSETHTMLSEMDHDIKGRGGNFEDYLSSIKKSKEDLILELLPNAIKRVKAALVIREVAKLEKVEVSEKDIDDKIEQLLNQYRGYEKVEKHVKEPGYRGYLHNMLINQKVMVKLSEINIEK